MKKFFLSLLMLIGVCGVMNPQKPYKVLKVHKNSEVTHTHNLSEFDSLTVGSVADNLNTHEYVDLDLPSGTLWATTNVGATSPADYGDYFAWGETTSKKTYNWNIYKWCEDGSGRKLIKYNTKSSFSQFKDPIVDHITLLKAADDAATANWGSAWRMPTTAEQTELNNTTYCTWTWTTRTDSNGKTINGYEVKSKSNGKSIFLPAAGFRDDTSHHFVGIWGYYWSSSLYTDWPYGACSLHFRPNGHYWGSYYRCYGQPVRPVRATSKN